jgi:hypothetical protein
LPAIIAGGGLPHGIDCNPHAARRGIHAHPIFGDPSGPNDVTRRVPLTTRTAPSIRAALSASTARAYRLLGSRRVTRKLRVCCVGGVHRDHRTRLAPPEAAK